MPVEYVAEWLPHAGTYRAQPIVLHVLLTLEGCWVHGGPRRRAFECDHGLDPVPHDCRGQGLTCTELVGSRLVSEVAGASRCAAFWGQL